MENGCKGTKEHQEPVKGSCIAKLEFGKEGGGGGGGEERERMNTYMWLIIYVYVDTVHRN